MCTQFWKIDVVRVQHADILKCFSSYATENIDRLTRWYSSEYGETLGIDGRCPASVQDLQQNLV